MTRRDEINPEVTENDAAIVPNQAVDFSILKQLEELQDIVYDSFHIPLTAWNVIDEEKVLDQVDVIAEFIPDAVKKATSVLERQEQIIQNAEAEAQHIIDTAYQQAEQIRNESGILQQAQQEADQMRFQVQQECEALQRQVQQECDTLQRQTLSELEQIKQMNHQELQQFRQQTLREAHDIQQDADNYADSVLGRLESNLSELMRVVSQSRQMLYDNSPQHNPQLDQNPPQGSVPPRSGSVPTPSRTPQRGQQPAPGNRNGSSAPKRGDRPRRRR